MNSQPDHDDEKWINRLGYTLVFAISLAMFWPVLFGVSEFGYRDSATLYQPLFEWISDRWLNGELPLWCAQDNWGAPVVADVTSSVFYPGKLIFLFRFLPFPVLFGVYVLLHVWLAVFGARWCGKVIGLSTAAAWLTGISYGFGGSVLFQSCNVVFLVSAAWLPIAAGLICRFVQTRNRTSLVQLAVVLSLMILGGDPQMAFHCLMMATIVWFFHSEGNELRTSFWVRVRSCLLPLFSVGSVTLLLTAVQVLPAVQWSQRSGRSMLANDRSIYRTWTHGDVYEEHEDGIKRIASPGPGTHQEAIYQFSQTPWSLVELIWPNILGKQTPWSSQLAGADRVWNGSIYLGVLTLLLAIIAIGIKEFRRENRTLLIVLTLFLLGSFGWYGIGWIVHELNLMRGGGGTAQVFGEPTGGVYWLMEMLIPGYYRFRYPAKLFVIASLVFCLLGGKGLDFVSRSLNENPDTERITRVMKPVLGLVLLSTVLLAVLAFLNRTLDYRLFGIVDTSATQLILQALLHTGIVLFVFGLVWWSRSRSEFARRNLRSLMVAVAAIELAVATNWTVQLVPTQDAVECQTTEIFDETIARDRLVDVQTEAIEQNPVRILSGQLSRDRQTLYPKFHLLAGKRLIGSFHSIQPLDLGERILTEAFWPELSVDSMIIPSTSGESEFESRPIGGRPRVYFATGVKRLWPVDERSRHSVLRRNAEVIDIWSDWASGHQKSTERSSPVIGHVIVECEPEFLDGLPEHPAGQASVKCTRHEHERQTFAVRTEEARLLVIADYFDPDWRAFHVSENQRTELATFRTNRVLTGIVVPTGKYEIEFVYRPVWFYVGVWISCLAWAWLAIGWFRNRRRR